ncbi:MAG: hypothetical protein RSG55_08240 [Oscillospiraceae bacterium]
MATRKQPLDEEVISTEDEVIIEVLAEPEKTEQKGKEKAGTYIYIGPTIPRTTLVENSIVYGTREQVEKHFASGLSKVPDARALIVLSEMLSGGRLEVNSPESYFHALYAEIASKSKI